MKVRVQVKVKWQRLFKMEAIAETRWKFLTFSSQSQGTDKQLPVVVFRPVGGIARWLLQILFICVYLKRFCKKEFS